MPLLSSSAHGGLGRRYALLAEQWHARKPKRDAIETWRKDGRGSLFGHDSRTDCLLRYDADRELIYTSGGIKLMVNAQTLVKYTQLYQVAAACKAGTVVWDTSRSGISLEAEYGSRHRIDSIGTDGLVKSGCHGIQFKELRRCAIALGIVQAGLFDRMADSFRSAAS